MKKELIIDTGVISVDSNLCFNLIEEGNKLLREDLEKITLLKPRGWIKIRNKINYCLKWINNKHLQLEDRAFAFTNYQKTRESFKNILTQ